MMLGGATRVGVYFLLLLNCFLGQDTDSQDTDSQDTDSQDTDSQEAEYHSDTIIDLILDHADTSDLETDRDEHFWESNYWSIPYDEELKCPYQYGWTGDFETGTCEPCPPGTEDFDDHWKQRCLPCPLGYYNDVAGGYCNECSNDARRATTFKYGAKSEEECVDPEAVFGESSYQSEVSVEVEITGDWSWLEDLLWQLSGINFYGLRAHVRYDESNDYSSIKARAMLPNFLAMKAHFGLTEFKRFLAEVNDYASMADHYAKIIVKLLNHAEALSLFGWQVNYNQLNLKNLKVLSTVTHLKQDCLQGYHSVEWEGVGSRCEADNDSDDVTSEERSGVYMMYRGEGDACKSLGGEARLREFIETSWPFPCLKDNQCEVHLSTSKELDGYCVLVLYLSIKDNWQGQLTSASYIVWYGETASFSLLENTPIHSSDCPGDPTIVTHSTFQCSSCSQDDGYRLTPSGNCEKCPFGTWLSDEPLASTTCTSCPLDRPGTVYGVVPSGSYQCINSDLDTWESGTKEYGNEIYTHQSFNLSAYVVMDMCEVDRIKNNFNNYCSQKYNMDDLNFDDFTDFEFDVEKLSCIIVSRFSSIYEDNCLQDTEYTWSDIQDDFPDDIDLRGAACFVAKSLYFIEQEESSDCEELDPDEVEGGRNLHMPFEITDIDAGEFMWAGGLWMPLSSSANKLVKFDFKAISGIIEGAMRRVGIYELSKLTGLGMLDHVRDVILAIPRGINVREGSHDVTTDLDDMFCKSQKYNPRKYCGYSCPRGCPRFLDYGKVDNEPTCDASECNECKATWSFNSEPYDCSLTCDAPDQIDHGRLVHARVTRYWDSYLCPYDSCAEYTTSYRYACDKNYRLNSGEDFDEQDCEHEGDSMVYCFYQDDNNYRLSSEPECIPEECDYPELEHGYITSSNDYSTSYCRSVEYGCDQGYAIEGKYTVHCWKNGTFSELPICVPQECEFPETMKNSRFITEFTRQEWSETGPELSRKGWYQCQNGYRDDYRYGDVYQRVDCGEETSCNYHYYNCTEIENGYLLREWREEDYYVGEYRCNPGYELRNPDIYSSEEDLREKYGWGKCDYEEEDSHLPSCVPDGSALPCYMPKRIWNGYLVEEIANEAGIVTHGRYECNDHHVMVETSQGEDGWCRSDGSFELPYCMPHDKYYHMEFELESNTKNSGFVKSRKVYANGDTGDWYAGCDDWFNDFAAGAICRSMGIRHGKRLEPQKKTSFMSGIEFGWTNVHCMYDDTLITSPTCNADHYGEEGVGAVCTQEEQIAVKCFDNFWSVSVEFRYIERSGKMYCPIEIIKEGETLKLKNMGLRVEWGGVKISGEDKEITELEEDVHYTSRGFSKKKGFRAKYIGNKSEFDCFYCKVFMGERSLNPEFDKNHNCDV